MSQSGRIITSGPDVHGTLAASEILPYVDIVEVKADNSSGEWILDDQTVISTFTGSGLGTDSIGQRLPDRDVTIKKGELYMGFNGQPNKDTEVVLTLERGFRNWRLRDSGVKGSFYIVARGGQDGGEEFALHRSSMDALPARAVLRSPVDKCCVWKFVMSSK